jgi:hypothetical protein
VYILGEWQHGHLGLAACVIEDGLRHKGCTSNWSLLSSLQVVGRVAVDA